MRRFIVLVTVALLKLTAFVVTATPVLIVAGPRAETGPAWGCQSSPPRRARRSRCWLNLPVPPPTSSSR
jgi:hypothetical protein